MTVSALCLTDFPNAPAIRLTRVSLVIGVVDSALASQAGYRLLAGCLVGLRSCILVAVDEVRDCSSRGGRDVADGLHVVLLLCCLVAKVEKICLSRVRVVGVFKDGELVRLFGSRADDVLRSTAWYKQATPRCTMRIRDVRASQRGTIHSSSSMCRN